MKIALKITIGFTLTCCLIYQAKPAVLVSTISNCSLEMLSLSLMMYAAGALVEITKLYFLIKSKFSFIKTAKLIYMGLLFNNLLPTNVGGDVYKATRISKDGLGVAKGVSCVLLDRVIGLSSLLVWSLAFGFIKYDFWSSRLELDLHKIEGSQWSLVLGIATGGLLITYVTLLFWQLPRLYIKKIVKSFGKILVALKGFRVRTYIKQFLLSTIFHACRLLAIYYLVLSFGESIELIYLAPILGAVAIFALLPISIGGIGVREGALTGMLMITGVDVGTATAVAMINMLIVLFKSAIGGIVFLFANKT